MRLRVSIVALATALLSGVAGASENSPTRLLLPPVVSVYEAGMTEGVRHGQWSHEATQHVAAHWPAALAGRVTPVAALSPEQSAAVAEFQRLAPLVVRRASLAGGVASDGLAELDTRLGPSLAFLAPDAGATTVVGLLAIQVEQSTGAAATQAALMASMLMQSVLLVTPAVTGVSLLAFEADARTGQVLWYEFDRAVEVGGVNTGDLRVADSAARLLQALAKKLPTAPPDVPARGSDTETSTALRANRVMPLEGHFEVLAPAGWAATRGESSLSLTRDGEALNSIEVRLATRGEVFRETRPDAGRDSTPEQFAQWYVAELQATVPFDLQVLDARAEGELLGKPAFRVHYLHRAWLDGPMLETIVVGVHGPRGMLIADLTAPHLAYFGRALPDFEKMLPTLERAPIRN
jgi:hypothetical protein